jgi:hypothetical protein
MSNQESEVVKKYLERLDDTQFLTKKQELTIGRRIKRVESKILKESCKHECFRKEFLKLEASMERNHNNVIRFTKDLTDDSDQKAIIKKSAYLAEVFRIIKGESKNKLLDLLKEINISSSLITQIFKSLKETHSEIKYLQNKTSSVYKFLEIDTPEEYAVITLNCRNPEFMRKFSKGIFSNTDAIIRKIREQEEVEKVYKTKKYTPESNLLSPTLDP